jgi:hypothetical protein
MPGFLKIETQAGSGSAEFPLAFRSGSAATPFREELRTLVNVPGQGEFQLPSRAAIAMFVRCCIAPKRKLKR